jgi:hypothetical protein
MPGGAVTKLFAFLAEELREALVPFVFFAVLFGLGRLTKALLLEEYHLTMGRTAVALIGALIVAKAILVADALPFVKRLESRPLVTAIPARIAVYWIIITAFHYLEELIPYARQYGLAQGHARLVAEASWPHVLVLNLWIGFALVLYCTTIALVRAIGPERVVALFVGGRPSQR